MNDQQCACHHHSRTPYDQSLSELAFERGIWQAAIDNNISKVKALLNKGHNVNDVDSSGYTALHYAARNKHFKLVKLLLDSNAFVNCVTKAGQETPLHRAAYVGDLEIVKILVNHGAQTELQNIDGQTCLHKAVQKEHVDVIQFLISGNPRLTKIQDKKFRLPSFYSNNHVIVNILD